MPITSKYSDEHVESILTEIAAVLNKHNASPELTLMVVGNIATNVINQNVAAAQRKVIAEKIRASISVVFAKLNCPI